MKYFGTLCLLLYYFHPFAQTCTTLGQTPSTALPVCGTTTFRQNTVPVCSTRSLSVPGCAGDGASYADKNPFWYKFTCYKSGTLGFLISPIDQGDDYDWQLFDITGRDPNEVFTNRSLVVTGNWAGTYGNTGASAAGVSFIQCASDPAANMNSFSSMPMLTEGHTYLLLVSHFTNSQSGYDLSFGGGTAVITDPLQPDVLDVRANCGTDRIRVKLNKKMKCSTIAADGSDFVVSSANVSVVAATGINCAAGFETDSVEIKLSSPIGPGAYSLAVQQGSDNNTILDFCDQSVPANTTITFHVSNVLAADFSSTTDICPDEPVQFNSVVEGQASNYAWSFGDGGSSMLSSPAHVYTAPSSNTTYTVTLSVSNGLGCDNRVARTVKVYSNCFLAVPSAFTPNGDGRNDFFHPLNAVKAENLSFKVFNRWGQLVFQTNDAARGWDGRYRGLAQPTGVYVWLLSFRDRDTKVLRQMKGTVALIR
ncbi:MAG: gliding motility-associated C-terminal domain-containing protein [Flavisolibacter sp.]